MAEEFYFLFARISKNETMNLIDVTEITERQKMAIWLMIQIDLGNFTKEQALDIGRDFNEYLNDTPDSTMKEYLDAR